MSKELTKISEETEEEIDIQEPPQYRVLLHNDHFTTMDFVVYVLETVFNKNSMEAVQIMLNVHKKGVGVCGVYTQEIAETKVEMVHSLAKSNKFPLRCSMEEI